jgi:hypothetical protein
MDCQAIKISSKIQDKESSQISSEKVLQDKEVGSRTRE